MSAIQDLSQWNYLFFGVHAIATIWSYQTLNKNDPESRRVQMYKYEFDESQPNQSKVNIPVKLEEDSSIDLKNLVVFFFAITAAAHLFYATDFFGYKLYSKEILGWGWNPYRWVEYSLSAGAMIYLISAVSGTKDQVSAISAALITPGLMINGFTTERELHQNQIAAWTRGGGAPKPTADPFIVWSNLIPGWFLYFTHWYIILSNYNRLSKKAKETGKEFDKNVQFMVWSQLVFFSLFGVIQSYQVWRWANVTKGVTEPYFVVYEKAYIILSAIAKLTLAITVVRALA